MKGEFKAIDTVIYIPGGGFDLRNCPEPEKLAARIARDCNYHKRLVEQLENALIAMEQYEEKVEGEWGSCRDLDEIERDGELPIEIIEARALLTELENQQ